MNVLFNLNNGMNNAAGKKIEKRGYVEGSIASVKHIRHQSATVWYHTVLSCWFAEEAFFGHPQFAWYVSSIMQSCSCRARECRESYRASADAKENGTYAGVPPHNSHSPLGRLPVQQAGGPCWPDRHKNMSRDLRRSPLSDGPSKRNFS